ncbi:phosphotransferase [Paenibacillus thermotolerans]|uniref:phosphotransferase n=1 Tax=Paenibacillus thermotolerans TaxID=3027807 RepID=UPI0023675220|nr:MULTISPECIES: phosphotransferase [unclassified Paenibacillus]
MNKPIRQESIRDIVKKYGLRAERIKAYDSIYRHDAAFRVSTDKGRFLVKPYHKSSLSERTAASEIRRIASHIKKLQRKGYPNMPDWLRTRSGKLWVDYGGTIFYMTEWIKGRPLADDEGDYEKLGRALGRLHSICRRRLSEKSRYTRRQIEKLQGQEKQFLAVLAKIRKQKTSSGRWFKENGERCKELAKQAWDIVKRPEVREIIEHEASRPSLIHGDVTIPNVLIDDERLVLIDWDTLRVDSAYYDISKALSNVTHCMPAFMAALLRGYESEKPLKPAERLLISALFRLPREAWYSAKKKLQGQGDSLFRIVSDSWEQRMEAVRWLDDWARSTGYAGGDA